MCNYRALPAQRAHNLHTIAYDVVSHSYAQPDDGSTASSTACNVAISLMTADGSDTSTGIRQAQQQLTGRPCGQRCSSSASAVVAVAGRKKSWWRRPLGSMLLLPLLRAASKRACAA